MFLASTLALLSIPDPPAPPPQKSTRTPFVWDQDERWKSLEERFITARETGCDHLTPQVDSVLRQCSLLVVSLGTIQVAPADPIYEEIESAVFALGPKVGACPDRLPGYVRLVAGLRTTVKWQSRQWDMNDQSTRNRMYRLLYGSRTAMEEVMHQVSVNQIPEIVRSVEEPSQTPGGEIAGMRIHSGDILVSRGGAPTSALISRGNDYPGNFSHVALLHVDSTTGQVSIIESHIEQGVAIASPEEYMKDTKLRIMVLRLRHDLPAMQSNPMLPHRAASMMLEEARDRHIPYDFAMDFHDTSKYFCSEVVAAAYRRAGVGLWMGLSSISSSGVASWLGAFGVQHFDTQEPSDLEYDPQLQVVAEWRDPAMLSKDRVDNAVIDVMLEGAERGEELKHEWYLLPFARMAKGYSVMLNLFGSVGPVPEGMNATSALKHKMFTARHNAMASRVTVLAEEFRRTRDYAPPYWELLKMARDAAM